MAFYEVLIQASQVVYVEADSEDEALDVACENYSHIDFEFDEGRCGEKFDSEPGKCYGKVIYK